MYSGYDVIDICRSNVKVFGWMDGEDVSRELGGRIKQVR
jgi:hypothetical protein